MRNEIKNKGRKFLRPLVNFLIKTGVAPSAVTLGGLLLGVLAGGLFATGHFIWAGVVSALVGLSDTIDGELSRTTARASVRGAILDSTVDRLSEGIILIGVGIYYIRVNCWFTILAMVSMFFSFLVSYVRARAEGVGKECQVGFFERPVRVTILVISAIFLGRQFLPYGLGVMAIGAAITFSHRFIYVLKERS